MLRIFKQHRLFNNLPSFGKDFYQLYMHLYWKEATNNIIVHLFLLQSNFNKAICQRLKK